MMREDEEVSALVHERFEPKASTCCVGHKASALRDGNGEKKPGRRARRQARSRSRSTSCSCAVGRVRGRRAATGSKSSASRHAAEDRRDQRVPADDLSEHLRVRRRRRAVPVHAHRLAPGLVRGGQRAVRRLQEVQGRLLGDSVGHLHRSRGRARRPERDRRRRRRTSPTRSRVYGIDDLDRAIADGEADGFVKVLTVPGKDRILGVTIVGEHAGDLLAEYVLAMKHGLGLNKILGTIHIYPTLAEANKYAAGEWKSDRHPGNGPSHRVSSMAARRRRTRRRAASTAFDEPQQAPRVCR